MPTDIAIVIEGVDRFSAVFDQLDAALGRASADLGGVAEQQAAALEALAAQQEQAVAGLSDRLLAQQAAADERRIAQEQRTNERLRQERDAHLARMVDQEQRSVQQLAALEAVALEIRLSNYRTFTNSLLTLAKTQGRSLAQTAKALATAQALIDTYLAANAVLAQVPYPLNFLAAAAVTAQGLANVQRIQQVSVAHGGLNAVPEDATFLLKQGERVISPQQNRDLTTFLQAQPASVPEAGMAVQNLTVHVLENATSAQALLTMDRSDLRRVVAERIIPALDELARLGIRPRFVESNT
jgi:hypothetical protein